MKREVIFILIALSASTLAARADYVYEGKWGSEGAGYGQFDRPREVALAPNGNVYVIDTYNNRVQYFKWVNPAVAPASLGRVKALFR